MLSPATFSAVANATSPTGHPSSPQAGRVVPARVLNTQPPPLPMPIPGAKLPVTVSPEAPAAPPRNLPRGSLLDLSV